MLSFFFPFTQCFSCSGKKPPNDYRAYKDFQKLKSSRITIHITKSLLEDTKNGIGIIVQPPLLSPIADSSDKPESGKSETARSSLTSDGLTEDRTSGRKDSVGSQTSANSRTSQRQKSLPLYPIVDYIYPNSIAEKYEITAGAKLTKIDYCSTRSMTSEEIALKLKQARTVEFEQSELMCLQLNTNQHEITSFPTPRNQYLEGITSCLVEKDVGKPKSDMPKEPTRKNVNIVAKTDLEFDWEDETQKRFWIPDTMAKKCHSCGDLFRFFLRRHHCRSCGHVFCSKCCYRQMRSFSLKGNNPPDVKNSGIAGKKMQIGKSETEKNKIADRLSNKRLCYECRNHMSKSIAMEKMNAVTEGQQATDLKCALIEEQSLIKINAPKADYVLLSNNLQNFDIPKRHELGSLDISVRSLVLLSDDKKPQFPKSGGLEDLDVDDYTVVDSAEKKRLKTFYQMFPRVHIVVGEMKSRTPVDTATNYTYRATKLSPEKSIRRSFSEPCLILRRFNCSNKKTGGFLSNASFDDISAAAEYKDHSLRKILYNQFYRVKYGKLLPNRGDRKSVIVAAEKNKDASLPEYSGNTTSCYNYSVVDISSNERDRMPYPQEAPYSGTRGLFIQDSIGDELIPVTCRSIFDEDLEQLEESMATYDGYSYRFGESPMSTGSAASSPSQYNALDDYSINEPLSPFQLSNKPQKGHPVVVETNNDAEVTTPIVPVFDRTVDVSVESAKERMKVLMKSNGRKCIRNKITSLLTSSPQLEQISFRAKEEWLNKLEQFTLKAVEEVVCVPGQGEVMDLASYVQIETFPGGNINDSFYVDGIIYSKVVARKNMRKFIQNPRLLLISSSLDYQTNSQASLLLTLETLATEINEYMRILASKLLLLNPDVVVVEGHVHRVVEDIFAKRNVCLIKNASSEVMKSLSRKTGAMILSSAEHADKYSDANIVGTCSIFKVVTFVDDTIPIEERSVVASDIQERRRSRKIKHSVIFEGGIPLKGGTVCLRGDSDTVLHEIRNILARSIAVAYNLKLEWSFFADFFLVPNLAFESPNEQIKGKGDGRPVSNQLYRARSSLQQTTDTPKEDICSFETGWEIFSPSMTISTGADRRRNTLTSEMESVKGIAKNFTGVSNEESMLVSVCWSKLTANSHSFAQMCCIKFCDPQADYTLSQFLRNYCFSSTIKEYKQAFQESQLTLSHGHGRICVTVRHIKSCRHTPQMLLENSMISTKENKLSVISPSDVINSLPKFLGDTKNGSEESTDDNIYMWLGSSHSFERAKAASVMSAETSSFSFGRFIETFFYSKNMRPDKEFSSHLSGISRTDDPNLIRYFCHKNLVASFSYQPVSPVVCVNLRPVLWREESTNGLIDTEELLKLSQKVYDISIAKTDILKRHFDSFGEGARRLRRLRAQITHWGYNFRNKVQHNPPENIFQRSELIQTMYCQCLEWSRIFLKLAQEYTIVRTLCQNETVDNLLKDGNNVSVTPSQESGNVAPAIRSKRRVDDPEPLYLNGIQLPTGQNDSTLSQVDQFNGDKANVNIEKKYICDLEKACFSIPTDLSAYHPSLPYTSPLVLVNKFEPTTIIAYSLASSEYKSSLFDYGLAQNNIGSQPHEQLGKECNDQNGFLRRMRLTVRTHIDHRFAENDCVDSKKKSFRCKSYYAMQFHALRSLYYGNEEGFMESLCSCEIWNSGGGKSGSGFMRTKDQRFVAKCIPISEVKMFFSMVNEYFSYMAKVFDDGLVSMLSKVLGIYQIVMETEAETEFKMYILVMENIFYGRDIDLSFDLKGKLEGRFKRASEWEANSGTVLWDRNFIKMNKGIPLSMTEPAMTTLSSAIFADTKFLSSVHATDYSLLVGYDRANREITCCIIDYVHKYDFKKMMEHAGKRLIQEEDEITVLNPKQYRRRFRLAMLKYFTILPTKSTKFEEAKEDEAK